MSNLHMIEIPSAENNPVNFGSIWVDQVHSGAILLIKHSLTLEPAILVTNPRSYCRSDKVVTIIFMIFQFFGKILHKRHGINILH